MAGGEHDKVGTLAYSEMMGKQPLINLILASWLMLILPLAAASESSEEAAFDALISRFDLSSLEQYASHGVDMESMHQAIWRTFEKPPEQWNLDNIKLVADQLTKLYRQAGYKFHSVIVPPQRVKADQAFRFQLIKVRLGDVNIVGDDRDLNRRIRTHFYPYVGQELYQPDIDHVVIGLKNQFGVDVFPYYSRGEYTGSVRLNVKAAYSKSWGVGIAADNFGNESTGENRAILSGSLNHLLQPFDRLSLGIQQVTDKEKNTYGSISYRFPLWTVDHQISLSYSNNVFEVGKDFASLQIEGDASIYRLAYDYTLYQSFRHKHALSLSASLLSNDYENIFDDPFLTEDEESQAIELAWYYQYTSPRSGLIYRSLISNSVGDFELENDGEQKNFSKLRLSQQLEWTLGDASQRMQSAFRLALKGQYAEDPLSSFDQFSLSGAYAVRDAAAGYSSADRGALAGLEIWFTKLLSFGKSSFSVIPFLYTDWVFGERLDDEGDYQSHAVLGGAGGGLRFAYGALGSLSVSSGSLVEEDVGSNPEPEEQSLLFQLQIQL